MIMCACISARTGKYKARDSASSDSKPKARGESLDEAAQGDQGRTGDQGHLLRPPTKQYRSQEAAEEPTERVGGRDKAELSRCDVEARGHPTGLRARGRDAAG